MSRLLGRLWRKTTLQAGASARQPRHHRADGNAGNVADLLVGKPFQLAQHDDFAKLRGQFLERFLERFAAGAFRQEPFGFGDCRTFAVKVSLNSTANRSGGCRAARSNKCSSRWPAASCGRRCPGIPRSLSRRAGRLPEQGLRRRCRSSRANARGCRRHRDGAKRWLQNGRLSFTRQNEWPLFRPRADVLSL